MASRVLYTTYKHKKSYRYFINYGAKVACNTSIYFQSVVGDGKSDLIRSIVVETQSQLKHLLFGVFRKPMPMWPTLYIINAFKLLYILSTIKNLPILI